ncbi:hypothetical protein EIN_064880 [Entamoeba invadens IP1]|uniref:Uncharacterized protein n=1 Tax=Entamoeba invadens IP1 TaxID=370355 RepID=A0A0A1U034_ENTIV|nr:hypothetical protein EIN_064880 [Entamoeba invadens IP1]ELP84253.1 hypothetical protein EIN_064880 [Entamoeba invadens IP1]|eukprot:XP_004183599.1 hypothetical protein EIN_064880 [Entamoeba invadens IP1]
MQTAERSPRYYTTDVICSKISCRRFVAQRTVISASQSPTLLDIPSEDVSSANTPLTLESNFEIIKIMEEPPNISNDKGIPIDFLFGRRDHPPLPEVATLSSM